MTLAASGFKLQSSVATNLRPSQPGKGDHGWS